MEIEARPTPSRLTVTLSHCESRRATTLRDHVSDVVHELRSNRGLRRGLAEDEAPAPDLESRLAKLQELHAKGLVSDDEYASKRTEILASL